MWSRCSPIGRLSGEEIEHRLLVFGEHLADRTSWAFFHLSKAFLRFPGKIAEPEKVVVFLYEDQRGCVIPLRKLIVRRRSTGLQRYVLNERDCRCELLLCPLLVALDEVYDRAMAGVGAHQEDVRRLIELDVVVPQVGQKLGRFSRPVLHAIFGLVYLTVLGVGDVFRKVHIYNSKVMLHRPVDVRLHNISLRSMSAACLHAAVQL